MVVQTDENVRVMAVSIGRMGHLGYVLDVDLVVSNDGWDVAGKGTRN